MNYDERYFIQFKSEKVEMSRAAMAVIVCLQRKMFSYSEHMSLLQLHILSILVVLCRWCPFAQMERQMGEPYHITDLHQISRTDSATVAVPGKSCHLWMILVSKITASILHVISPHLL